MASVADDLGPEATPEPEAWPPAPRAGETQAQAPVRAPAREPSTPAPTDDEVDVVAGNGAAAATATSVGYDRPTRSERRAAASLPPRRPAPSTERRYRQTVAKVDLWSVLKMSLCFYICAMAVADGRAGRAVGDRATRPGSSTTSRSSSATCCRPKDFTSSPTRCCAARLLVALVLVALAGRDHGDRRVVLQHLRRALRRHRDHDHRGRDARCNSRRACAGRLCYAQRLRGL